MYYERIIELSHGYDDHWLIINKNSLLTLR